MIDRVRFIKGHGTGNDFVILPDADGQLELTPGLVAAVCHRRFGLGADGVLRVVRAAKDPDGAGHAADAEWFMDYRNADGSVAEMCGNGVRVFARFLVTAGLAEPAIGGLPIATRAGVVRARLSGDVIAVDMGLPRVYAQSAATLVGWPESLPGTAVDCGNPHLVCPVPAGVALDSLDLTRPPGVDAGVFPAGVNVEFVTPAGPVEGADLRVRMRVFERGSGETLSCGSGACAVAAVALAGAGRDRGVVLVDVPGGRLTATFDGHTCWLSGPAVLVASGDLDPTALAPPPPLPR
jgi:diaminopimelate epimerase